MLKNKKQNGGDTVAVFELRRVYPLAQPVRTKRDIDSSGKRRSNVSVVPGCKQFAASWFFYFCTMIWSSLLSCCRRHFGFPGFHLCQIGRSLFRSFYRWRNHCRLIHRKHFHGLRTNHRYLFLLEAVAKRYLYNSWSAEFLSPITRQSDQLAIYKIKSRKVKID